MKFFASFLIFAACAVFAAGCSNAKANTDSKKIIFAYGNSVHLWGDHENEIMCEVLAELVNKFTPHTAQACDANAPDIAEKFASADAVIIICEGGEHHPFKGERLPLLNAAKNLGAFHYALDFGTKEGDSALIKNIGGAFELNWSVNPMYPAKFESLPNHPASKGANPFELYDEWYFNMRFSQNGKVTNLLKTVPPDSARKRSFGTHSGNQFVRANLGREETILWLYEKADGTRGLGFTGGHSLFSLYENNLRKLLLNSAIWLAHGDIPADGFHSKMPAFDELASRIKKEKRPDQDSYTARWRKISE